MRRRGCNNNVHTGAELPRRVFRGGVCVCELVHRRAAAAIHLVPVQAQLLPRHHEHLRRARHRPVLRHSRHHAGAHAVAALIS